MKPIKIHIAYIYNPTVVMEYIIVYQKEQENIGKHILHYTNPFALELLSAAYAKERHYRGYWKNQAYNIVNYEPKNKSFLEVIPDAVVIKHGGGYYSSVKDSSSYICDILFYSPRTKCFEPVHVTYDTKKEIYYMSMSLYRQFIREHGNPKVFTLPDDSNRDAVGSENISLKTQSVLNLWGYNTNADLQINQEKRWEVLQEIVDLEILQVKDVVAFLEFLIRFNGKKESNQEALLKWQVDLAMISEYKICPERFVIVS